MIYGYARVSTGGQSEAAQVRQLRAAGAGKVFREVASGAKTDRPPLRRLLAGIGPRDVVMVTRLEPLARSARDLIDIPSSSAFITPINGKPIYIHLVAQIKVLEVTDFGNYLYEQKD